MSYRPSRETSERGDRPPRADHIEQLLGNLAELEAALDDPAERERVRRSMSLARRIPGSGLLERRIQKYTTRDMAEAFVGSILLSLPLLVEDGVFVIAAWFVRSTVAGVPVFLAGNVGFVVLLTIGLIYWSDIRQVQISNPLFGLIPRRLVGVLTISFLTATFLFLLWGRHVAGEPGSAVEFLSQVTVVWAAAAFGAALGDILPGESRGHDVRIENIDEIVARDG